MNPNSADSSSQISVLIVEDTHSLLKLYSHILEQAGYVVFGAENGQKGLDLIESAKPDIVLLDRVLPDMDGSNICSTIKTNPDTAAMYVIMLSALRITEDDRVSGLEAGADDYIVKPIGRRELLARVNVATRLRRTQKALQDSEAMFRTLAENSPDIISRIGRDLKFLYINNVVEQLTGVPATEYLGTKIDVDAPRRDDIGPWLKAIKQVFETGEASRTEFTLPSVKGDRVMDARLVPETDVDGTIRSILSVSRDFTEHSEAEQQIARLATVIEQETEAVAISDPRGIIAYVNAAFEDMLGTSAETIVGKSIFEMHEIYSGDFCASVQEAIVAKEAWSGIGHCTRSQGVRCEIDASVFPIYNREGSIIDFAIIQRDVTESRRTERQREALLTIATALRNANKRDEMVDIVLDKLMSVLTVSSAMIIMPNANDETSVVEDARGVSESYIGRSFPTQTTLPSGNSFSDNSTSGSVLVDNNALGNKQHPIHTAMDHPLSVAAVPLIAQPHTIGTMWIGCDDPIEEETVDFLQAIANMAATAIHSADLYDEIQRYAAGLEQMVADRTQELASANEQLLELDRLKSKFVSNVSHELRTPISNLKLYLALLQRGKPERRAQYESMLRVSVDRLGQLVEDILNLSRIEISHQKVPTLEPTDLNGVISQVVSLHQPQADAAGIKLVFKPDPSLPLIGGDYNQLSQLVTNLVANALNYTPDGQILVSTSLLSDEHAISMVVEDTGIGILADDLPHLFDRFYRGNHRQENDIPGTGLGLAIVREIVDIHDGSITVSSEVDKGTRFDVRFPVEEVEDQLSISWLH